MQVDLSDIQRRYDEMTDEEFALLKRTDLLPEVQAVYDRELARRSSPEWIARHPKLEIGPDPVWPPSPNKEWRDVFKPWRQHATLKRIMTSWLVGIVLAAFPWIVQTRNIDLYHNAGETINMIYLILDIPGLMLASRFGTHQTNVGALANSVFYGLLVLRFLVRRAGECEKHRTE